MINPNQNPKPDVSKLQKHFDAIVTKKEEDRNQEEFVDIIKGIFGNKNGEVS